MAAGAGWAGKSPLQVRTRFRTCEVARRVRYSDPRRPTYMMCWRQAHSAAVGGLVGGQAGPAGGQDRDGGGAEGGVGRAWAGALERGPRPKRLRDQRPLSEGAVRLAIHMPECTRFRID